MTTKQIKNLVICGTDTDVGKTVVSAFLVQGLNACYWKPIQSGLEEDGDRGRVCKLLNLTAERWIPEVYKLKAPVSPHWAAERQKCMIKKERLNIPNHNHPIIIETAGGLMVPLTYDFLQIELLKIWNIPVILVARSGLGTLNHTLLSLEALRLRKIPILGIILNGPIHPNNPKTLEKVGKVPVIAEIPRFESLTAEKLLNLWQKEDLHSRFKKLISARKNSK